MQKRKWILARWAAVLALAWTGSLAAHHSLANFDTTTPVWVKGTIVVFERVNPHSLIFLDEKKADGTIQRWAVDGPGPVQLERMSVQKNFLKVGDVIEVCGFTLKDAHASERTLPPPVSAANAYSTEMKGRVMNGHLLVMPDGQKKVWSNYGFLEKCLN